MRNTKLAIILGTRPEITKMAPIIKECEKKSIDFFILHTGQHYSYNLDKVFFEQLELPEAKYNLAIGSGSHAEETGKMLIGIEKVIRKEKPYVVLVQGDTNTVLAGALAASKLHIKIGHVEAGLRSYDRNMPEEINRVLTDHIADYLFAPTDIAKENILKEGIEEDKIFVTGNTLVDVVFQNIAIRKEEINILADLKLVPKGYFLATVHREENVDHEKRFKEIIKGLELIVNTLGLPVIYPIHPRAKEKINRFRIRVNCINFIEPLDFLTFLHLESNAKIVLTDSGGVQEETCILGIPCVTLRENTERPETIKVGSNILVGTTPENILKGTKKMLRKKHNWKNPFGDGKAAERIVKIICELGK